MKKTGFKNKARKPLKRTPLKRSTQNTLKRSERRLEASQAIPRTSYKGYKPPKWFTSLKPGSHGNTPAQKKYWKVVSDTYRKEDFERYGGKCVSCPTRLERWEDGQLAHYKAWSVCNSFFKYERKNLALSCPNCNRLSDGIVGHNFGEELKRRHGDKILDWIQSENEKYRGQKMEVWEIVERVTELLGKSKRTDLF